MSATPGMLAAAEARLDAVLSGPVVGRSRHAQVVDLARQRVHEHERPEYHEHSAYTKGATATDVATSAAADVLGEFEALVSDFLPDRQGERFAPQQGVPWAPVSELMGVESRAGPGQPLGAGAGTLGAVEQDAGHHDEVAETHDRAAERHDKAAAYWAKRGDAEWAELERWNARLEREGADLERERARVIRRRQAEDV